jgi:ABC-type uncharacterized transport system permease subunit
MKARWFLRGRARPVVSITFSVLLALLIGALFIMLSGANPLESYAALVTGAFGQDYRIGNTLARTAILTLVGLAAALAFEAGYFNLGQEGQLFLGSFAAAWVGIFVTGLPPWLHIPLAMLAAAAVGGAYSAFFGFLKARWGVDEVVSTIMGNTPAILLVAYLTNGPYRDPAAGAGMTVQILESARLPKPIPLSDFNASLFLAVGMGLLIAFLMRRTVIGYDWEITGKNARFARYGGVDVPSRVMLSAVLSGVLAGLAGAVLVVGQFYRSRAAISIGYGWDGVLIAMIVKNNPLGVMLLGLVFGTLGVGGLAMEARTNVPSELIIVVQSIIILFVAGQEGLFQTLLFGRGERADV